MFCNMNRTAVMRLNGRVVILCVEQRLILRILPAPRNEVVRHSDTGSTMRKGEHARPSPVIISFPAGIIEEGYILLLQDLREACGIVAGISHIVEKSIDVYRYGAQLRTSYIPDVQYLALGQSIQAKGSLDTIGIPGSGTSRSPAAVDTFRNVQAELGIPDQNVGLGIGARIGSIISGVIGEGILIGGRICLQRGNRRVYISSHIGGKIGDGLAGAQLRRRRRCHFECPRILSCGPQVPLSLSVTLIPLFK